MEEAQVQASPREAAVPCCAPQRMSPRCPRPATMDLAELGVPNTSSSPSHCRDPTKQGLRGTRRFWDQGRPQSLPQPRGSTRVPAPCPQEHLQVQPKVSGGMSHWDRHGAGVTARREGLLHLHPTPFGWDQLAPAPSQADTGELCWDRQTEAPKKPVAPRGSPRRLLGMDEDTGMLGHVTRVARLLEMLRAVLPGALRAEDG